MAPPRKDAAPKTEETPEQGREPVFVIQDHKLVDTGPVDPEPVKDTRQFIPAEPEPVPPVVFEHPVVD